MKVSVLAACGIAAATLLVPAAAYQAASRHITTLRAPLAHGRLHGDPRSGCTWVADPSPPVEVRWAPNVTVRFAPTLELVQAGHVVAREGTLLAQPLYDRVPGTAHCPAGPSTSAFTTDVPRVEVKSPRRFNGQGG